jgi:putative ABC transport system permease protein
MGTLLQDFRFAWRLLLKSPAFTAVAVLSLALGIGANSTIFTLVNAVLLHPLPMKDPDSLVAMFTTDERNRGAFLNLLPTSPLNYADYRKMSDVFSGLVAHQGVPLSFAGKGEPEQIFGEIVSGDFFSVLGATPALGRGFLPDEDKVPGASLVAVVSNNFWQRQLGGDPGIVGQTLKLNGHAFTVVGVAAAGFKGVNTIAQPALWVPYMTYPQVATGFFKENIDSRRALIFNVAGRLKPGVTLAQAEARLKNLATQLGKEYPNDNGGRSVALLPLAQATINPGFRDNMVSAAGLLLTVVGLVLLIACANVANLLLARASVRQREVAVRLSLGASRRRLIRQLLTEGLLLAIVAGVLGMALAYWAQGVLWSQRPPGLAADAVDLRPDLRVLGFTLGVSLLTAVLFGLLPAWRSSRPDLASELKQRGGGSGFGSHLWSLRNMLVSLQVAVSLCVLIGAGLFVKSLGHSQKIDPGFDYEKLALLTFDLGAQGYDDERAHDFQNRVLERVSGLPGVERATLASGVPLFQGGFSRTVFPEGVDSSDRKNGKLVQLNTVKPGYFETMGIPLKRGRDFAATDHKNAPHVVVINETMARQFWPEQEALGKRFKFFGQDWWNEVVGVAKDGKYNFLGENPQPHIYLSLEQVFEPAVTLHVRTSGDPTTALGMARKEVQAMDRLLPITGVFTFGEILRQSLWAPRMGAALLVVFGLLSLVLAVIGIYGVMSYSVNQRTRELGLRMALGAEPGEVVKLVVTQGSALALVGIGIGLAVSLGLGLLFSAQLSGLLFDVSLRDPLIFVGIPLLLAAAALVASAQPAWRASRVDPTVALRIE